MRKIKKDYKKIINFPLHPKQEEIYESDARFKLVVAGRRFGKTTYVALYEALPLLFSKMKRIWIVAPTYSLADKSFREVYSYFLKRPFLYKEISRSKMFIESVWGSVLIAKSADNPISLVGEGLDLLIIDECAAIPDRVYYEYLRPTLSDREGRGVFISTPKDKNWFYRLYEEGLNASKNIESFHYTSYHNVLLKKEEIDSAKRELPSFTFEQEYLARFSSAENAVFREPEKYCVLKESLPLSNDFVSVGLDLGRKNDYTVLTAISSSKKEMLKMERFNKISWQDQIERILNFVSHYENYTLYVDSTGLGDPIFEEIVSKGAFAESVIFSAKSKSQLIEGLLIYLENKGLLLLKNEDLFRELKSFRVYSSSLYPRYEALASEHDDIVMSLALAVRGLSLNCSENNILSVLLE